MESPQLWITAAIAGASFLLGFKLAPSPTHPTENPPSNSAPSIKEAPSPASTIGSASTEEPKLRTRSHIRPEADPKGDAKVSIPVKRVVSLLKKNCFEYRHFDNLDSATTEALEFLGATDSEKSAIADLIKSAEKEIYQEEARTLKVTSQSDTEVKLDLSPMAGPSEAVVSRLQDGIRNNLSSDLAVPLIESINWKKYYLDSQSPEIRLTISNNNRNSMTAWVYQGTGGTGQGIDREKYADNGTPIPADEVFDERWKPFLKGVTLLPTEGR